MKWCLFIVCCLFLEFQSHVFAANKILHYELEMVELQGTLEIQTFPGPPNYENIEQGDSIEQSWYLKLTQPITVKPKQQPADLGWKTEHNVKVLQLMIEATDFKIWKELLKVGKRIKATGTLQNRLTGHHHSRVLMKVDNISEDTP